MKEPLELEMGLIGVPTMGCFDLGLDKTTLSKVRLGVLSQALG